MRDARRDSLTGITMTRLNLVALLGLVTITACASSSTLTERNQLLQADYQLYRPEGNAQTPIVLMFHGCGGLYGEGYEKDIMRDYAAVAVDQGYAALVVDSFSPRDIEFNQAVHRVCTGLKLRGRTRAGDVLAAVQYAKSLPFVDHDGIVLAGWSHGGWTVMESMIMDLQTDWPPDLTQPPADLMDNLAGVYLTYPYCGFPSRAPSHGWARTPPTEFVRAERDTVAKAEPCDKALEEMRNSGVPLDVEVFSGVTHAFDESDQTEGSSYVYDPVATARAHERFAAFLNAVKPQ